MKGHANETETGTESSCQKYRHAIEFIGKRWTGIIIYNLFDGPKRYYELLNAIDGISDRLLTERLKDLEEEGLLVKHIIADSPRKVEYELTEPGHQFKYVFKAILDWNEKKDQYVEGISDLD